MTAAAAESSVRLSAHAEVSASLSLFSISLTGGWQGVRCEAAVKTAKLTLN